MVAILCQHLLILLFLLPSLLSRIGTVFTIIASFCNPEALYHNILQCYIISFKVVAQSCPTLCDPMTVAHQVPLSMGFSRQEYWSALSFSSPGDLSHPGIEHISPALQANFYHRATRETLIPGSVQFSHSVVSNSLRPHESQHARPPCPSPTPRVHSDLHPLSQ